jgi:hypothetical protein
VSLSSPSVNTVTVQYTTQNGTARAGGQNPDYTRVNGTLTFAPGETTKTITVLVNGDTLVEPDETFFVVLSGAVNASIAVARGTGTIVNDDTLPNLSINNVAQDEGNSGTTPFVFTVTLSTPSASTVTVKYATADGTATSHGKNSDYTRVSGKLTFDPGVTTQTITVLVNGDTLVEPDETFFVNLSDPQGATIAVAQGTGTILNDDGSGSNQLGSSIVPGASVAPVSEADPSLAVDDVIARGSSVTHTGTLDRPLIGAHGPIANLSGHKAEMSSPGVLLIDVGVPGHAWLIDPVLDGNEEFTMRTGLLQARRDTKAGVAAAN